MNTLSILALITATAVSPLSAAVLVKYDFDTDHLGNAITGSLTGGNDGPKVNTVYPSISFGQGTSEQRVKDEWDNAVDNPTPYYWQGWDGNMMRLKNHAPASGPGVYAGSADVAGAVTNASYFAVTFNPLTTTSFTHITFEAAARVGSLSPLFELPVGVTVRSSVTGDANLAETSIIRAYAEYGNHQNINIDLTGFSSLQEYGGAPVTFYFYLDSQGTTGRRDVFIDNLTLHGTQAIPEPSSLLLLGCGLAGLILPRRRAV